MIDVLTKLLNKLGFDVLHDVISSESDYCKFSYYHNKTLSRDMAFTSTTSEELKRVKEDEGGVRLEDASIIVSGGRGIGSTEGFHQLQELAAMLQGAVGASRPPCDNRWTAPNRQVGITGKIVSPDLYIAIGLSGSIQHLSGCGQSKIIVAINKDPEANIFNYANFGVVGDWKKVLPAFRDKLKELLSE